MIAWLDIAIVIRGKNHKAYNECNLAVIKVTSSPVAKPKLYDKNHSKNVKGK